MGTNSRLGTATRRGALCSKMQQATNPIVECLNHKETPFAEPPDLQVGTWNGVSTQRRIAYEH